MNEARSWFVDALACINWLDVLPALAPVATTIIAYTALRNWQRQDKAKRQAEFLDSLIDSAHTYIAEMPTLIRLLKYSKIGMDCHVPIGEGGIDDDKKVKGAIAYIEKHGKHDGQRLLDALTSIQPSLVRLHSLAAKGQVFKFKNYATCHQVVQQLASNYDRIGAFTTTIADPSWNWDNPKVLEHLKAVLEMDPSEMEKSIEDNNVVLLKFAADTYDRIYR